MREIPLTHGYIAFVDDQDYERVASHKWHADVRDWTVYAKTGGYGRGAPKLYLHRFVLEITDGKIIVDHKDSCGLNCQRYNLRTATSAQNVWNRKRHSSRRSSSYKGVRRHSNGRFWMSMICAHGVVRYLGLFTDEIEAARAYDDAARQYFGDFAKCNFPRIGEEAAAS